MDAKDMSLMASYCDQLADALGRETPSEWASMVDTCLLYTSPSPRDRTRSRMPSSA